MRKPLPWWRRPINSAKLPGILGTRGSLSAVIAFTIGLVVEIVSTPWLSLVIVALIVLSCLFALIIRSRRRSAVLSILKLNGSTH